MPTQKEKSDRLLVLNCGIQIAQVAQIWWHGNKRKTNALQFFAVFFFHFLSLICLSQIVRIFCVWLWLWLKNNVVFASETFTHIFFSQFTSPNCRYMLWTARMQCAHQIRVSPHSDPNGEQTRRRKTIMKEKNSFYAWLRHNKKRSRYYLNSDAVDLDNDDNHDDDNDDDGKRSSTSVFSHHVRTFFGKAQLLLTNLNWTIEINFHKWKCIHSKWELSSWS